MVGVLTRMKLAIVRHTMTGSKAAWTAVGALVGLALACGTVWLAIPGSVGADAVADLLAAACLMWALGWVVGPAFGGAPALEVDHFALLPLPRRRLAVGLLGTAFVAITAAVTLLAFGALVVYAARLGPVPALVAVPGVALELVFVVLLSRLATVGFGRLTRSRTGAVITGVANAAIMVLAQVGWVLYVALVVSGVLVRGFPPTVHAWLRALPSGWALVAVEAAARGAWWLVAAALGGLVVLGLALLGGWSLALGSSNRARPTIRGSRGVRPGGAGLFAGRTGAVVRKELRTWTRDTLRIHTAVIPLAWAVGVAALPLTFGSTVALPWAGVAVALMAASCAANLYGMDGTALWLTLLTGSERADVRGREIAYLLVFGPVTAVLAVAGLAWGGQAWAVPWVLALTPALLGGGAGIVALVSVALLAPGADAHKRPTNPLEQGEGVGNAFLVFVVGLLPAAPAAALLWAGTVRHDGRLLWAAVPVGVATGALLAWWLGDLAARRLARKGPQLLLALRGGRTGRSVADAWSSGLRAATHPGGRSAEVAHPAAVSGAVSGTTWTRQSWLSGLLWIAGPLLLFPQGIVPIVFLLIGAQDTRVWFGALYLPAALRWPAALAAVALGAWLTYLAVRSVLGARARTDSMVSASSGDLSSR